MGEHDTSCCNGIPKLGGVKNQAFIVLEILEVRSSKSRCGRGHIPSKGSGVGSSGVLQFLSDGPRCPLAVAPAHPSLALWSSGLLVIPMCLLRDHVIDLGLWI